MASTGLNSSVSPVEDVGVADLVVGLPTFNHAGTIGAVVAAARSALHDGFSGIRWRVLVVDGGSTDGTQAAAKAAFGERAEGFSVVDYRVHGEDLAAAPYHGVPARDAALRTLFDAARRSGARAVAALDSTAVGVTPAWIARLAQPALDDAFDFVAPRYQRHAFEGVLIRGIVQPVFRACYGLRLQEPMPADFGCSSRMLETLSAAGTWPLEGDHAEIDLWLAATAASRGLRVCEAALGPKRRGSREDVQDLSGTIAQIVGGLFNELEGRAAIWHRVRGSVAVPLHGTVPNEPMENPTVNPGPLLESFRLGYRELVDVWAEILPPATILEYKKLSLAPEPSFRMDDRLWARTIYDFALGHRLRVMARDHLLRSLTPLYLGWLASFILFARNESAEAVDARLDGLCQSFEAEKPYLISRWRWPERFRPMKNSV
jgi:hypothetical protein